MNNTLSRLIFEQGAKLRNPSLFEQYDELKSTEFSSLADLQELQLRNARSFLKRAEKTSPYYEQLFKKIGFRSDQINSISDLHVIPEINKNTLITENASIHATNLTEKTRIAETSGTSGAALSFKRTERWDSLNRATMMRSYDWYGVKPWDRNGYLWGYNISDAEALKVKILDGLQNRFRLFNYSHEQIASFAKKLETASFLSGYSSMIFQVAKAVNELELPKPGLKMVKGTSEMILDVYSHEAEQAFGRKIISEYGAAESGLIAFECPDGSMHINIENLLLEQNENGEAIVTNFASLSFPIIRYNLGDTIVISDRKCTCGRQHPVLLEVTGRKGASVIGNNDIYPGLTFYYVFKNLALQKGLLINYKAVQDKPGKISLFIEKTENEKYKTLIFEELEKYFGNDLGVEIYFESSFEVTRKKQQYFESRISSG